MSPARSNQELTQALSSFLWRQWSQLGVAGHADYQDHWIIDPEALLLFTLLRARRDPRLFEECLDWCVANSRHLSVQRIKNIESKLLSPQEQDILTAVARILVGEGKDKRWSRLASRKHQAAGDERPLFMAHDGAPLPTLGDSDPEFKKLGLIRSRVAYRGLSMPVPIHNAASLLFRLRALFGLGARADAVTYLLTRKADAGASEVAQAIAFNLPQVKEALDEMALAGGVGQWAKGRQVRYTADQASWAGLLGLSEVPCWIDWVRVFQSLNALSAYFCDPKLGERSEYLRQSRALSLLHVLETMLPGSGLPIRMPGYFDLANCERTLENLVQMLASALAPALENA